MFRFHYLILILVVSVAKTIIASETIPTGLTSGDWNSIRAEYERNRHYVFSDGSGYRARNLGQQWLTRFDGRGFLVEPDNAPWRWGLELRSYGFSGNLHPVENPARITADQQRVAYSWDRNLEEWFVNDRSGLEHGFTLRQRPAGGGKFLTLLLSIRGGLRPRVHPGSQGVSFLTPEGSSALEYAGLKVWDAAGKTLAASLHGDAGGLRLEIDESGARYPITIDPTAQQAYLKGFRCEIRQERSW